MCGGADAFTNDMINTITQGSDAETWTLDPAGRDYDETWSGSTLATVNHFSTFSGDSPSWSSLTNATGVTSTSVNDPDLTGQLAATTNDTSSSTAITYQLTDPHGNVLGTANPVDPYEVVTPIITDEFGNLQTISGAPASGPRYGWLGGVQRDAANVGGIVLMGARGYIPALGRFTSVDAILGGNANPYDYCDQDPINEVDLGGTYHHWFNIGWYTWSAKRAREVGVALVAVAEAVGAKYLGLAVWVVVQAA
jgi:RHS repeat-associated protein